jgi:hypothetical protein
MATAQEFVVQIGPDLWLWTMKKRRSQLRHLLEATDISSAERFSHAQAERYANSLRSREELLERIGAGTAKAIQVVAA